MAEVYVAKTKGIGGFEKLLAIKVIHPRFSEDDHFVQLLVEEAKITVQLSHVNIAQTFDLGCIEETYYIAMELVDGADAFKVQKRASERGLALPIDTIVYIGAEVCSGLAYAHRKRDKEGQSLGIVHRDVSPQNVLLSHAGEVKLVDFGIAKAALRSAQTEVGVIKGKYYYMSPEQAWGDPVDLRTDVFATGLLLHELLTGRMVYRGESVPKLLDKVREANIDSPRQRRRDCPPDLARIVMKAVAKEPADRYPSADAMCKELTRLLYELEPSFTASRLSQLMATLFPDESRTHSQVLELPSREEVHGTVPPPRLEPIHKQDFSPRRSSLIFDPKRASAKTVEPRDRGDRATAQLIRPARGDEGMTPPRAAHSAEPGGVSSQNALGVSGSGGASAADAAARSGAAAAAAAVDSGAQKWDDQTLLDEEDDWEDETLVDSGGDPSSKRRSPDPSAPPVLRSLRPDAQVHAQVAAAAEAAARAKHDAANRPTREPGARPPAGRLAGDASPAREAPSAAGQAAALELPLDASHATAAPLQQGSHGSQGSLGGLGSYGSQGHGSRQDSLESPPPREDDAHVDEDPTEEAVGFPQYALSHADVDLPTSDTGPAFRPRAFRRRLRTWVPWVVIAATAVLVVAAIAYTIASRQNELRLDVTTVPPGAVVYLDDTPQPGQTPLTISSGLEPGRTYRVEVRRPGYKPYRAQVSLDRRRRSQVFVLVPIRVSLRVETEPPGSRLSVDEEPVGITPLVVSGLTVGQRVELRASHQGRSDVMREVVVTEDPATHSVRLVLPAEAR